MLPTINSTQLVKYSPVFTSKIVFEENEMFLDRLKGNVAPQEIKIDMGDMNISKYISSVYASSCMIGGVLLDRVNEFLMFHHTDPVTKNGNTMELLLDVLKKDGEKLKGLIVGGQENYFGEDHFINLIKFFKNNGVQSSILWGQPDGQTSSVVYDGDEHTWHVFTLSEGNENVIHSAEDIKEHYTIINIHPEDEVYIGDVHIDKAKLKQNKSINISM